MDNLELLKLKSITLYLRYNKNHDAKGRFTSSGGGLSGSSGSSNNNAKLTTAKDFQNKLDAAKASQDPDMAWRVDNYSHSEDDYKNDKLFTTPGGSTVAVTPDGDIISVCKNKNDENVSGSDLLKIAVENGGKKLDSFSGNHEFYVKNGFEPVSYCKFDKKYAPPGWNEKRDVAEDIIFYKYTGKVSSYKKASDFTKSVAVSADYDTAQKIRDKSIK